MQQRERKMSAFVYVSERDSGYVRVCEREREVVGMCVRVCVRVCV